MQYRKMSRKASYFHYNSSLSGLGAPSHTYIQSPPLRYNTSGSRGLYYDDGNKLLISPTSDQVFLWKAFPFDPRVDPVSHSITEGPILSIRYSLDSKYFAVQRSKHEVEFLNRETGETFHHRCKPNTESILGFFWTDYPSCDIVFVKTSGLELYYYDSKTKSLHLGETKRLNVSWYIYTHESRLVLLASGMQCKNFVGFQISSAGLICLPKFEMAMARSEANSKPVLAAEDIHNVTVYGRIYCLQVDRIAMQLHSYRFYRDAIVQQGSLPIYSSKIAVSVVDNVLLVHQVDAKVVILYDIFVDSRAPISAPLPLLLKGFPKPGISRSSCKDANSKAGNINEHESIIYGDGWTFLVPDLICDVSNGCLWKIHLDLEAISASCSEVPSVIEFLQRRKLDANKAKQLCLATTRTIILERRPVSMVSRAIDVLVTSYSHSVKMGTYYKGVKGEESSPWSPDMRCSRTLTTSTGKSANEIESVRKLVTRESSSRVESESPNKFVTFSDLDSDESATFGSLKSNSGTSHFLGSGKEISSSVKISNVEVNSAALLSQPPVQGQNSLNANVSEPPESQMISAAISPDEIYSFVFVPIEEEMSGDASYLVTIIVEFLRSANVERIQVHPNLYVLTLQLLACNQRFAEIELFVVNKIVEPSKEVAQQLIELRCHSFQMRKLGLDMLRQLSLHQDYILLLVHDGYYLEALRYARKNKVDTILPLVFLDAAFASNDSQHLASVFRFFSDSIPGFSATLDHTGYNQILNDMRSVLG